jgi:nucleotide-binding universal stress UspA family protein
MTNSDKKRDRGSIVCATRGGAGSRAVQEKAINYAHESDCRLIFLYIIDTTNVDGIEESLHVALQEELRWMGSALLNIAHKRAENRRINSKIVIREGKVLDEICEFLEEDDADLLLLGAPRGTTTASFGDDPIERFAESIEGESGVPVEIVRPDPSEGESL